MNIKKMFFVIVATLVMVTSTCFAQITMQDLNIGNLYIGQPMSDVIKIYGEPIDKEPSPPKLVSYIYKFDTEKVYVSPANDFVKDAEIVQICIEGFYNKYFVMNSGIGLGSTMEDVLSVYGEPVLAEEMPYTLMGKNYPALFLSYAISEGQKNLMFVFIDSKVHAIYMWLDNDIVGQK